MTRNRVATLLVVLFVAVVGASMLAAPAAASEHVDTLAGDGTDTVTDFNASEDRYLEYTLNSDDGTNGFGSSGDGSTVLYLNITDADGHEHVLVENTTFDGSATSHTFNVSQDELGAVAGDANGTSTISVNAWGEDDSGTETTSMDSFDADLEYQDSYAVVYVGDHQAAGDDANVDMTANEPEGILATLGIQDDSVDVEADNVGLGQNASGTTVHVVVANQSGVDAFTQAEDAKLLGSYESGDFMKSHLMSVEGHPHAVFHSEAPTDDLADDYTYAEVGQRNGHDAYTLHVKDDYEGENNVDLSASANDGPTFAFGVKRDAFGGALGALTAMIGLLAMARPEV